MRACTRRSPLLLTAAWLAFAALLAGCEDKLDPNECAKIRDEAFELLNKAQHCNTDADCRQSAWPGCAKPVSLATTEQLKPMSDRFTGGKCEEPKVECKPAPESYCKQGLCVHREKGVQEGAGSAPTDQIIVK